LVSAPDGGDYPVWFLCPPEGTRVCVDFRHIAVDCCLEFDDRAEDAALEATLGEFGEEALDGIEPGA
jgi:hypothetical protein